MKRCRAALILVSWVVLTSPVLAMGADNPLTGVEKRVEPQLKSDSNAAGRNKKSSEDQGPGSRAAQGKRTRYGMGYESRRKNSSSTTGSNRSGRGNRSGRSRR